MNSDLINPIAPENIPPKRVHVGDVDIAYKIFGRGEPLMLIPGFSATMDVWDPIMLGILSSNHTIILLDNRGMGKTTAGNKTWSMEQSANDTAGLIDALGIRKPVDVLALSWGGYVAQELALTHPQKVNKLILYGTDCGGKGTILSPQIIPLGRSIESGNATLDTYVSIFFPKDWLNEKENAAYVQKVFSAMTPSFNATPKENIQHQAQTTYNWKGACGRLSSITKPTLVITGTDDIVRPPANSLMLAEKIPGAWLVQIKGGGHGVMWQYPDKFSRIVLTFLET
ncbi:MAG TPA: alpha/beta hydrolase [Candidatus Nitrosopolaris sp.]|nr:alpha/beta hydrolase [Candidatus Nitrosopolaris sp.]